MDKIIGDLTSAYDDCISQRLGSLHGGIYLKIRETQRRLKLKDFHIWWCAIMDDWFEDSEGGCAYAALSDEYCVSIQHRNKIMTRKTSTGELVSVIHINPNLEFGDNLVISGTSIFSIWSNSSQWGIRTISVLKTNLVENTTQEIMTYSTEISCDCIDVRQLSQTGNTFCSAFTKESTNVLQCYDLKNNTLLYDQQTFAFLPWPVCTSDVALCFIKRTDFTEHLVIMKNVFIFRFTDKKETILYNGHVSSMQCSYTTVAIFECNDKIVLFDIETLGKTGEIHFSEHGTSFLQNFTLKTHGDDSFSWCYKTSDVHHHFGRYDKERNLKKLHFKFFGESTVGKYFGMTKNHILFNESTQNQLRMLKNDA